MKFKPSFWSLVEILRKSQSLEWNLKNWIWSCFGRIIPVIIEFICSWNIWFLRECLIFFQLFFKKVHLKTLNWTKVIISTYDLSRNNIFHQNLYQRIIMKNSFKIPKGTYTSKLKVIFSKFGMLLVKESKFMIYKKVSTIGRTILIQ